MGAVPPHAGFWAALVMLLSGCFRPTPLDAGRAVRLWRDPAAATRPDASSRSSVLTLSAAQAALRAGQHAPVLREAGFEVAMARGRGAQDKQLENPEVRIRDVELERAVANDPTVEVALRVPIPRPWDWHARAGQAKLRVHAAEAHATHIQREVQGAVFRLYAELATIQQAEAALFELVQLAARHGSQAAERVRQGELTRADASRLLARIDAARDELYALRRRRDEIADHLGLLTGTSPASEVIFAPGPADLALTEIDLDEAALVKRALRERIDLKEAASRVAVAEADVYLARSGRWPWFRFAEVGYNYRSDPSPGDFEFSAAFDVPFFNLNSGAIAEYEAQLARSRFAERMRVAAVVREVRAAARHLREATARAVTMREELLPALAEEARATREALERGLIEPVSAVASEWRRIRAQRRYLDALLDHRKASIALKTAVGVALQPRAGQDLEPRLRVP